MALDIIYWGHPVLDLWIIWVNIRCNTVVVLREKDKLRWCSSKSMITGSSSASQLAVNQMIKKDLYIYIYTYMTSMLGIIRQKGHSKETL